MFTVCLSSCECVDRFTCSHLMFINNKNKLDDLFTIMGEINRLLLVLLAPTISACALGLD